MAAGATHPGNIVARIIEAPASDLQQLYVWLYDQDLAARKDVATQSVGLTSLGMTSGSVVNRSLAWGAGGFYFYRDGAEAATDVTPLPPWTAPTVGYLGNRASGGRFLAGFVAALKFDRILNARERTALQSLMPKSITYGA